MVSRSFVDLVSGFPKAGLAPLRRSDPMDADTTFSARQPQPRRSVTGERAQDGTGERAVKSLFFLPLSHSHILQNDCDVIYIYNQ